MVIFKLYLNREPGYIVTLDQVSTILEELDCLELDSILSIQKVEMPKEEVEKLPEFAGW